MMMRKSTVAALSILMAVATAHPYAEWNNARYRWNAARGQEVGARVKSQASVELSSCALVTETSNGTSYRVRICTVDPGFEDSPNNVCLVTRVNPCCPSNCSLDNLVSSAQVSVAGEDVTVAYYLTRRDKAARVCFRLDDAHQGLKTCSQPGREDDSCLPPCLDIIVGTNTVCFNNTLTGDSSSCDGNVCQCKTGYLPPDCCQCDTANFYLPDCKPFCRDNCRLFRPSKVGGCSNCRAGFTGAPECCLKEECDANLKPDGTCAEGALEPDCCECDTTGNATHAFYKNEDDECIPFCKSNCAIIGDKGCTTCNDGFGPEPNCCEKVPKIEPCDKNQTLYFYIDATASNKYENFCPLMVVLQMLMAAFNPSSTSGTKIGALLFSDNAKNKPPSPVFDVGTSCFNAVQESNRSLLSLLSDFGVCLDKNRTYDSTLFPSLCGDGTSAVKGLEKIHNLTSSINSTTKKAILMLTDGIIEDNEEERETVLSKLNSMGITLIAAGVNDANSGNLGDYTADKIVIKEDPMGIKLGVAIVRKLEEREIICKEHADNITASLKSAQEIDITLSNGRKISTLELFCRCHRKELSEGEKKNCDMRTIKYPTCGDDVSIGVPLKDSLSFGLPNLPSGRASQNNEALEYMDRLLIEKEILAAVEKVLEERHG